jgi:hypothetical protein
VKVNPLQLKRKRETNKNSTRIESKRKLWGEVRDILFLREKEHVKGCQAVIARPSDRDSEIEDVRVVSLSTLSL